MKSALLYFKNTVQMYAFLTVIVIGSLGWISLFSVNKEKNKSKNSIGTPVIIEKWREMGYNEIFDLYNENKSTTITIPTRYYIDIRQQDGSIKTVSVTEFYWNNLEL